MRFAVRRPATRPVTPRDHRPAGGDVAALPAGPSGRLADRGVPALGRRTLARMLTAPADVSLTGVRPWRYGEREMPVAATLAGPAGLDLAALTGQAARVCAEAGSPYGPEVLESARVLCGRPEETAHLGETTDRLLLRHLREGRTRPGSSRRARPPMLDEPSTTTEIPGRERRSLPGVPARALTSRGR